MAVTESPNTFANMIYRQTREVIAQAAPARGSKGVGIFVLDCLRKYGPSTPKQLLFWLKRDWCSQKSSRKKDQHKHKQKTITAILGGLVALGLVEQVDKETWKAI